MLPYWWITINDTAQDTASNKNEVEQLEATVDRQNLDDDEELIAILERRRSDDAETTTDDVDTATHAVPRYGHSSAGFFTAHELHWRN